MPNAREMGHDPIGSLSFFRKSDNIVLDGRFVIFLLCPLIPS